MLVKMAWLALAGACGTVSRFAVYEMATKCKAAHFAVGTLAVNIVGSFLFGFIYSSAESRLNLSPEVRVILLTGFVGSFTTFSTFAFDTARILKSSQWMLAIGNVTGQVVLGLAALVAGVLAGKLLGR